MTGSLSYLRLDTTSVKVLAHPLRSRLLGALRLGGPATATALAARLATNSGAASYHLRRMAEAASSSTPVRAPASSDCGPLGRRHPRQPQ